MSYELNSRQDLGENVRRIFRRQIDAALALARGHDEPDDTRVHALRKHLKKARAVLLMVQKDIVGFRRQDKRLRDVGRLTRELRDAEVRLQTLRQVREQTPSSQHFCQKIERQLTLELENFVLAFDGWETQAIPVLETARKAARKWSLKKYGWPELRRAVRRTYKCGRKALLRLHEKSTTARLHQLRRWVKRLEYQLRILRPLNPRMLSAVSRELIELGELLGRTHDMTILADRLRLERRESYWGTQGAELLAAIEESEAQRRRDGTEIAEQFFAPRASKFGSYLNELRKGPMKRRRVVASKVRGQANHRPSRDVQSARYRT